MQNLLGVSGKMYVSEKIAFPSLVLVILTSFPGQIITFFFIAMSQPLFFQNLLTDFSIGKSPTQFCMFPFFSVCDPNTLFLFLWVHTNSQTWKFSQSLWHCKLWTKCSQKLFREIIFPSVLLVSLTSFQIRSLLPCLWQRAC